MNTVIVSPYDHGEITTAAIRLGDYLTGAGRTTAILATNQPHDGVDCYWDKCVRTSAGYGIAKHARHVENAIYFHPGKTYHADVELGCGKRRVNHILVADTYTWNDRDDVERYDYIICPSRTCYAAVRTALTKLDLSVSRDRLLHVNWDTGITPRTIVATHDRLRLAIAVDTTIQHESHSFFRMLWSLREYAPRLHVTVLHTMQWDRITRRAIRELRAAGVEFIRYRGRVELMSCLRRADWCAVIDTKAVFGSVAMTALTCGLPVFANDYGPYRDLISRERGELVPCDVIMGRNGTVYAGFRRKDWLDYLLYHLKDAKSLLRHLAAPWQMLPAAKAFSDCWNRVLN